MINLQELEFDQLLEYHELHKYILNQYKEGMPNVLLIDEVQLCPQFELAINSIYVKRIYDIYITGSNAFLLSSDLATLFTGKMCIRDRSQCGRSPSQVGYASSPW